MSMFPAVAEELAQRTSKAPWANQFDNVANRQIHIDTPARIWSQRTQVDAFVSAVGTGGTLAGTAMGLLERNRNIKIALADPQGAALYEWYANGELKSEGSSISEGIGQGRVTANLEGLEVDFPYLIPDSEALPIVFDLLKDEGFCVGLSSGINVAGAIRAAKELGPGHTVVTLLCDLGQRYSAKLWNPAFLKEAGLPVPDWL